MLNIPDAIKTLFQTDGTNKNFRVHFPNGELPDITNSSIVSESVEFNETVCSQNVFKFGLTEASEITFETVGISNMVGMEIECGIEIDTSSLSAAQISAISSAPGDGVLVLAADSDIGHGYYRVPLGTFIVNSCPRNHEAMTHRKVTAYSVIGGSNGYNPFEAAKLALPLPGNVYDPNAYLLALSCIGYAAPNFLTNQGFTKRQITNSSSAANSASYTFKDGNGSDISVTFYVNCRAIGDYQPDNVDLSKLHAIDLHGFDYSTVPGIYVDALEAAGVDYAQSGYDSWDSLITDALNLDSDEALIYPSLQYKGTSYRGGTVTFLGKLGAVNFKASNYAFYPMRVWNGSGTLTANVVVPTTYRIVVNGTQTSLLQLNLPGNNKVASLYEFTPSATIPDLTLHIIPTSNEKKTVSGVNLTLYGFADAFSLPDMSDSFLELLASYGRPARDGSCDILQLDNTSPIVISLEDVKSLWWDEYDVSPVGSVKYRFGDGAASQDAVYTFGNGDSVYDMTENAVLPLLSDTSSTAIETFLSSVFVPQIPFIEFTPVDLTILGMPWIEAGDALQITSADNVTVTTYALQRTLKGIQDLTDTIVSNGGFMESGV